MEQEWHDNSQRMLNVMMNDTVIPIHWHAETTETIIVLNGSGNKVAYDNLAMTVNLSILGFFIETSISMPTVR